LRNLAHNERDGWLVDMLDGANGMTHHTVIDHRFFRSATIDIVRQRWIGAPYAEYRSSLVSRLTAHEMGHALGIVRYTSTPGTIMLPISATDFPAPLDVKTIKAKYCELFPH
jgi:predicted Zn-dependent protease